MSEDGTISVPVLLNSRETCVNSPRLGKQCVPTPKVGPATITVKLNASGQRPDANVEDCPGGAVITVHTGGGSLHASVAVDGTHVGEGASERGEPITISSCE